MNLCRFQEGDSIVKVGLAQDTSTLIDLTPAGMTRMEDLLESENPIAEASGLIETRLPRLAVASVRLSAPIERQEVWAAGVTYLRSKAARMEESNFSAMAYDRVYEAERPELFFKSLPEKVAGPGEPVGIRRDSRWNVPEPELALVLNSRGVVVGYTIGNDMSSRDIEGENLLYLPQAKIYSRSCALGPWICLGATEATAREWKVSLEVDRGATRIFYGETSVGNIKRRFDELAGFLFRSQTFSHGAILLTGTGIVPADPFTLQPGDLVRIAISGIGSLTNHVVGV
jgi:2-dehydro-3-deoxy-D-arabinonate dehydratase